jgi:predicted phage terminase large subunit-like protein
VGGRWAAEDPDVEIISIPMRGEPASRYRHPLDIRDEGELMWPARYDEDAVAELERTLGPTTAAAQLQQRPVPPGGALFTEPHMAHRYAGLPSSMQRAITTGRAEPGHIWRIYGDCTFKGKPTSDYTVFQLWCRAEGAIWIVDQIRGQWSFREAKQRLADLVARYRCVSSVRLEDAANAPAMVDDMRGEIPFLSLAPVAGGVLARVQQCEATWAAGSVRLPARADWLGGSDGFIAEHLTYDGLGTRHDDQVSASSLAVLDLVGSAAVRYADTMRRIAS